MNRYIALVEIYTYPYVSTCYCCQQCFDVLLAVASVVVCVCVDYKYGVQLHAVDRETPYQFNCDSYLEREEILEHLDNISTCVRDQR